MSDHHRIHSTGKRGIQSCRLTWSVVVQVCAVLGEDLDDLEGGAAESLAIGASRIETRCDYTSIEAPTPLTAAPCFKKNSRAAPICRTLPLPDCLHRPPPLSTTVLHRIEVGNVCCAVQTCGKAVDALAHMSPKPQWLSVVSVVAECAAA